MELPRLSVSRALAALYAWGAPPVNLLPQGKHKMDTPALRGIFAPPALASNCLVLLGRLMVWSSKNQHRLACFVKVGPLTESLGKLHVVPAHRLHNLQPVP